MGLFSKEEKTNVKEGYEEQIKEFLLPGENIENIYSLFVDFMCFTNKRLIFVDKEISLKEPKTTINSIPYSNILSCGLVKNEKVFALADELIFTAKYKTYNLKFLKGTNIKEVYNKMVSKIV